MRGPLQKLREIMARLIFRAKCFGSPANPRAAFSLSSALACKVRIAIIAR
jgi:hypothetical protein